MRGWLRSVRHQKSVSFMDLGDGTAQHPLQVVASPEAVEGVAGLGTGASVEVVGTLARSGRDDPPRGKEWEVVAESPGDVRVVGACDADYPLQKKRHTLEFLRDVAHVRMRSNTVGAAMRVRAAAMAALHAHMRAEDVMQVTAPVLTPLDCEGAGEMFEAAVPGAAAPFFGRPAYLGVSGQLYAEMAASALSRVYAFGPTFRAENSHTQRHVCEFWMLEPEIAHARLPDLLDLAEGTLKAAAAAALDECAEDLQFCDERVRPGVAADVEGMRDRPFARVTYTEAVRALAAAPSKARKKFRAPAEWGAPLGSDHERYLAEAVCGSPVFVTDYPAAIKPFYMRASEAAGGAAPGPTAACFDLILPHVGEVVGGSEREERAGVLRRQMDAHGLSADDYSWYVDLRRFGTVPHGGFGVGFERLVQALTGIANIRDVSPVPRTPGGIKF